MHRPAGRAAPAVRACRRASAGPAAAASVPAHRTPDPRTSSTSRSIERGAQRGAPRGRPHALSMACSFASTAPTGSCVAKPATRLMKSSPAKPTRAVAIPGARSARRETRARAPRPRAPGSSRARHCCRRRRRPRGTGVRPAGGRGGDRSARVRSIVTPTSRELRMAPGLLSEMRTQATPNSSRMSSASAVRERLHQLELGSGDERQHALGHLLVVERVGHLVAERGAAAVDRHLDVEHHRLLTRRSQSMKPMMHSVVRPRRKIRSPVGRVVHGSFGTVGIAGSRHRRQRLRAAIAHARRSPGLRAGPPAGAPAPPRQSSPRCRWRIRCADSTRARRGCLPRR